MPSTFVTPPTRTCWRSCARCSTRACAEQQHANDGDLHTTERGTNAGRAGRCVLMPLHLRQRVQRIHVACARAAGTIGNSWRRRVPPRCQQAQGQPFADSSSLCSAQPSRRGGRRCPAPAAQRWRRRTSAAAQRHLRVRHAAATRLGRRRRDERGWSRAQRRRLGRRGAGAGRAPGGAQFGLSISCTLDAAEDAARKMPRCCGGGGHAPRARRGG